MHEEFAEGQQHRHLGNYELLRLLGVGRYTEVYLGKHIHLRSQAAVKIFHENVAGDELTDRLVGLRRAAALRHPHIARILEFGSEGGRQFLVSEYAMHGSLRQVPGARLPLSTVVAYVDAVADALQYMHERGLVHGAIKPENILLGQGERVLLTDCRALPYPLEDERRDSLGREPVETATYLAPEQWQGCYEPASDQYALAVVVYEWLGGEPPFQGSPAVLQELHRHAMAPALPGSAGPVPRIVEQALQKALAKEPRQRFADIQAFARTLAQAAAQSSSSDKSATLLLPQPVAVTVAQSDLSKLSAVERAVTTLKARSQISARRSRLRTLAVTLSGLLAVLLLVGSGLLFFRPGAASSSQAQLASGREATIAAMSTQELYTFATRGQPVISDKLDRPQSSRWSNEQKNEGKGSCAFQTSGGTMAYHIIVQAGAPPVACFARSGNFSNFAFQVNMLDTQGEYADNAGVAFCGDNAGSVFNLFTVSINGYSVVRYQTGQEKLLTSGLLPIAVDTNLAGQQLSVIAYDGHYYLYMDGHFIARQDEERACSGSIGFFVGHSATTERAVSNYAFGDVRVWQL